jgi:hypothetical protein
MTIHTQIESPYRVYSKNVDFKIFILNSSSKNYQISQNAPKMHPKLANFEWR